MSERRKPHPVYGDYPDPMPDMGNPQCAPEPPFWVFSGYVTGTCWLHPSEAVPFVKADYISAVARLDT